MKKLLLSVFIFVISSTAAMCAVYSLSYSQSLQECKPFIEKYKVQIPTQDTNTPVLNLQSTETILGWQEGKCVTKSMVYSSDLNKNILETKCAFTKNQIDSITKKIAASNKGDKKASQSLQEELSAYSKDENICVIKNLLEN